MMKKDSQETTRKRSETKLAVELAASQRLQEFMTNIDLGAKLEAIVPGAGSEVMTLVAMAFRAGYVARLADELDGVDFSWRRKEDDSEVSQ